MTGEFDARQNYDSSFLMSFEGKITLRTAGYTGACYISLQLDLYELDRRVGLVNDIMTHAGLAVVRLAGYDYR